MKCPYCGTEGEHRLYIRDTEQNLRIYICDNDECREDFVTDENRQIIYP